MEILKNSWVVGIATGIISGILVFFFNEWIMDKRGKAEYFKRVDNANQNVIEALKPYVAENGLPNLKILKALIMATARSFSVDSKDMFSVSIYCEELIREIIKDVYVSNEKKQEYTNALAEYIENIEKVSNRDNMVSMYISLWKYREKLRRKISIYIAIMAAMLVMISSFLLTIYSYKDTGKFGFWYPFDSKPVLWIPIIIFVFVILIMVLFMGFEIISGIVRENKKLKETKSDGNGKLVDEGTKKD